MPATIKKWLTILLVFYTFISVANAQTGNGVNGIFSKTSFKNFVAEVEKQLPVHFYYDAKMLDTFPVTASAVNSTLSDLLKLVFNNSTFHFAITSTGNIIITQNVTLKTNLPSDYFTPKQSGDSDTTTFFMATNNPKKNAQIKIPLENRLFEIGARLPNGKGEKATVAGYVKDIKTGEPIAGTTVYTDSPYTNTTTDQFGYYSLTLPTGRHTLHISSFGMKTTARQVQLNTSGKLNIELEQYIATLKEVVVIAEKASNTRSVQMGVNRLSINNIKLVPALLGEADILKVVLSLPGVTSVGEASTGFNVRGGAADQNLILLNDATIYNPSHLFGFFTAFNPDVVKGVELYKSAIPEKYGGRLSSVLDVTTLDGNNKKVSGNGGIGPLTCKLMLEGPIKNEKTTFVIGGRTTYSDWLLRSLPNNAYNNSRASFNDLTLRLAHTFNTKNSLYVTGYISNDRFRLNSDTTFSYQNKNMNLKWKHIFNNQLYMVTTTGVDNYNYKNGADKNPVTAYNLSFNVRQLNFKTDFVYTPGPKHNISFGFNAIQYKLHPGTLNPSGKESLVVNEVVPAEQGIESALYFGDRYAVNDRFSINAGLRFSMFNYLGPHEQYQYVQDLPRDENSITDTIYYAKNKVIKSWPGAEIRLAIRYSLSNSASIKLSYNTLRQYIHMLSNTTSISPTDTWKLSDAIIKPQTGDQLSLGYYLNLRSNTIETSVELYFKRINNYLDYKSGANLLLNKHIETDVFNTKGKAYGFELMIKKNSGKLNGWISYTYARTLLKMDDPLAGQTINKGEYYPANFDKPHNANLIGNYKFSHRYSFSLNIVFSTGRPITIPIALYNIGGGQRVFYSDRNAYRVPDYFRADFSMNIDGNHKIKKLAHSFWSFGVYNLTARKNPYSIYFVQENGVINGYKLSIFGTAIPFISYNFKF